MNTPKSAETASAAEQAAGVASGIGPFILGLGVVALLILAVWWGRRRRAEEPPPPRPEEQPRRPAHRTHIEESDPHSSGEFPPGERLGPHQLGGHTGGTPRPRPDEPRD